MHYTIDNPPAVGAKVMLDIAENHNIGPFTVESFNGSAVYFSDREDEWFLYKTIERIGCRDATSEELESTH